MIIKHIRTAHVLHDQRMKHVYLTSQIYTINEYRVYIIIIKNSKRDNHKKIGLFACFGCFKCPGKSNSRTIEEYCNKHRIIY